MENVDIKTTNYFTKKEAEIIANENLGLIHHIIGTLNISDYDYTDLYDAGLFGYTKAIQSFDKGRNVQFSTYACNCIRNEILAQMKKDMNHISNDVSLHQPLSTSGTGNEHDLFIEDIVEDPYSKIRKTEDKMIACETQNRIEKALIRLTDDEQFVIKHRFGILGYPEMKQKEIAKILKMSQANVSKLEQSGLKKLKLFLSLYK